MTSLESIYSRLPVPLQNLLCSVEGARIQWTRFGPAFDAALKACAERGTWSADDIERYQQAELQRFIAHAVSTVPYYRSLFQRSGWDPRDICTRDDLVRLPLLTKADIQQHPEAFLSESVAAAKHVPIHTSGTTGAGFHMVTTAAAVREQWAVWWRYRGWHGIPYPAWCAYFGGRTVVPPAQSHPPLWRINGPGRQVLFSGYHMAPSHLKSYVTEIQKRRLRWIHGYPSLIALLAAYIVDNNIRLGPEIQWVTTGAENLLPHQRDVMRRAFGVEPREHYGMAEAAANISECPQGKLHVDEDFSTVEFIPHTGDTFRVVGTSFTNPAMPLIRYEVNDIVTLESGSCSCGRPGRLVAQVDGRREDYVILKNGARVGRMDHIFKDLVHIREAQIHQSRPGEILIRVVKGDRYQPRDEVQLLSETRSRLGPDTEIRVDYVVALPRTSTGKLRLVVSDIRDAKI